MNRVRAALTVAASGVLLVALANPASARTIYFDYADVTSGSPTLDGHCRAVYDGREKAGEACFKHYGDRMWVKDTRADGAHIEIRGEVNNSDRDAFRCYGTGKAGGGWRVCDEFADEMPENHRFAWNAALVDGDTVELTADLVLSSTSG